MYYTAQQLTDAITVVSHQASQGRLAELRRDLADQCLDPGSVVCAEICRLQAENARLKRDVADKHNEIIRLTAKPLTSEQLTAIHRRAEAEKLARERST